MKCIYRTNTIPHVLFYRFFLHILWNCFKKKKNLTKFMCVKFTYAIMSCEKTTRYSVLPYMTDIRESNFFYSSSLKIIVLNFPFLLLHKDYTDYSIGLARKGKNSVFVRQNNNTKNIHGMMQWPLCIRVVRMVRCGRCHMEQLRPFDCTSLSRLEVWTRNTVHAKGDRTE